MKVVVALLAVLVSGAAFAAGDGHAPGPGSLIAPAINVAILLGGLIYLLRTPARDFFASKSTTVAEMLERASSKAKEAEMMMEVQRKKASGVEAEVNALTTENAKVIKNYETEYALEVESRIEKLKEDAAQKIEAEKKELLGDLNSKLLDLVIAKAKTQIKSDAKLANNSTNNIIKGL
jgi:F-type H+-transporting ATPase subunit b